MAEGKRAVMRLAQALLRDALDQGPRDEVHESNIMPLAAELSPSAAKARVAGVGGGFARLWRR